MRLWGLAIAAVLAALIMSNLRLTPLPYDAGVVKVSAGRASGTGVALDTNLVVTAAHVAEVAFQGKGPPKFEVGDRPATLLWLNKHYDVAVLVTSVPHAVRRELACRAPTPGEPVTIVGFPMIGNFTPAGAVITSGIVATLPQADYWSTTRSFSLVTANAAPGNSGGPLFDRDGKVIGIATAMMGEDVSGQPDTHGAVDDVFVRIGYTVVVPGMTLCKLMGRT